VFFKAEELYSNDVVSDVLVGVIYVNKLRSEKSLLWFLIPGHTPKPKLTEKQTKDRCLTLIELLKYQGSQLFQQGFERLACQKTTTGYTVVYSKMAKAITCGLDSLPCRVVNIIRYVLMNIMGKDVEIFDRTDMYEDMDGNDFCKATVENLFQTIRTILADEISTIGVENPLYVTDVKRITAKVTDFKAFLTDTEAQNDLRKFLEFAHSALKELLNVQLYFILTLTLTPYSDTVYYLQ
jgi:hypothetical protein